MAILWDFSDHRVQSLIFKVTEQCNLGCNYCYRQGMLREKKTMSLATIDQSIRNFSNWLDANFDRNEREISLVWHGGEPLICGIEYYEKIYSLIETYKAEGYRFRTAFQTNGTLINKEWLEFFGRHDISIGISIDGDRFSNDLHRHRVNGRSAFADTVRGIKVLQEANYPFGGIAVVTNESVRCLRENLDFFVNSGFTVVDFIPSYLLRSDVTLTNANYQNGLIELYDYWKSRYSEQITLRFLGDIENKLLGTAESVGCELAGYCGENFSINVDGDVYPCECLSTYKEFLIGNVHQSTDYRTMITGSGFTHWKTQINDIDETCTPESQNRCEVQSICKGGCYNRRYNQGAENMRRDHFCGARSEIIKHVARRLGVSYGC